MILLVDDIRTLPEADVIARTYDEGLDYLTNALYHWDVLMIDHDLGEGATGYDLVNKCLELRVMPECVVIVSSNPVGVSNIERALQDQGYRKAGATKDLKPVWKFVRV